jgi:hypothetical protein
MDTSISVPAISPRGTVIGNSYQVITFLWPDGTNTTPGVFSTTPSAIQTNGDELILPSGMAVGQYAEKDFVAIAPADIISLLRLRAKTDSASSATLTVRLLDSTGSVIGSSYTFTVTLAYSWFSLPISPASDVAGVQLQGSAKMYVDYVALASPYYINQGGMEFDLTIPKKTVSQTVPNTTDVQQQLGISSNSYAITIPKVSVAVYNWLIARESGASPIEMVTPTKQATGYLLDVEKTTDAGWVAKPLPSSDSLAVTATIQQLYDVTCTLAKADTETNLDISAPIPPTPPVPLPAPLAGTGWAIATDGTNFFVSTYNNPTYALVKLSSGGTLLDTFAPYTLTNYDILSSLYWDGTYLYCGVGSYNGGAGSPTHNVWKLNSNLGTVATSPSLGSGVNPTLSSSEAYTMTTDGFIYFDNDLTDTLSCYSNDFSTLLHSVVLSGHVGLNVAYDGTYLWWASYDNVHVTDLTLARIAGETGCGGWVQIIDGNVYVSGTSSSVYTDTFYQATLSGSPLSINLTPLATPVVNETILACPVVQGSYLYIAVSIGGSPGSVKVFRYDWPSMTLDGSVTVPDIINPGSRNLSEGFQRMIPYGSTVKLLTASNIYDVPSFFL